MITRFRPRRGEHGISQGVPPKQGGGSVRFLGDWILECVGTMPGSLNRPEHRQDCLADRWWQGAPDFDHAGQFGVDWGVPVSRRCIWRCTAARIGIFLGVYRGHVRNHNPRVGGSSPSSATCACSRIRPHHTAQVRNWQGLGRFRLRSVGIWFVATARTLWQGFASCALRFEMT